MTIYYYYFLLFNWPFFQRYSRLAISSKVTFENDGSNSTRNFIYNLQTHTFT